MKQVFRKADRQDGKSLPVGERRKFIDSVQLKRDTRSDIYHHFKHIDNGQWRIGTSSEEYLGDLRQGILHAERISSYIHQNERVVGFFARNGTDVSHLGPTPEKFLYIVYSINRHAIITGYQASGLEKLTIPRDAVWLK